LSIQATYESSPHMIAHIARAVSTLRHPQLFGGIGNHALPAALLRRRGC
jgi:hypothetical protein